MKAALWISGIVVVFVAVCFAVRRGERVLAEQKLGGCDCRVVWRYSPFSLSREPGTMIFVSEVGARRREQTSGFSGDWSGNAAIEWTRLSELKLQASDRYSGAKAVFTNTGEIAIAR